MITEITRSITRQLNDEVREALEEVAARHGLQVTVGGGSYDSGMFKPKVVFKTGTADEQEFASWATIYGLVPGDFGRTFVSQGRMFRIAGVSPRSPKRPILCTEVGTDKRYKFPIDSVKYGLAKAAK